MKTAIFVDVQNIYYTTRDTFKRPFNYRRFMNKIESKDEIFKAYAYAIDKGDEKQQKFQFALQTIGFNVKLKPYIQRSDGSAKGDWDVGICIDVLDIAENVDEIVLLSGDGDFDLLLEKIKRDKGVTATVYGVEGLTSKSLIDSSTHYIAIDEEFLL